MNNFYYDENKGLIWMTGADDVWPSRTYIYNTDGEYLTYDDSGDCCSEWCEQLNCSTLEEALTIIRDKTKNQEGISMKKYKRLKVYVEKLDETVNGIYLGKGNPQVDQLVIIAGPHCQFEGIIMEINDIEIHEDIKNEADLFDCDELKDGNYEAVFDMSAAV